MNNPTKPVYSFLLVCQTYPPVIGGSEVEAQRVCSELVRRGHRVTVICAGGPPMPPLKEWIDPEGVPVRLFAARSKGAVRDVVFALSTARVLISERRNYQFVYFLMQGLHLAAGVPVAKLLGKPVFMKIAGSGEVGRIYASWIGRQELDWLNRWAQKILILNEGMRQEAVDHGISAGKLEWMPNPVDTERFSPASTLEITELRRKFGIADTALVVVYVGRLAPEKGLPILLDSFSAVVRQFPDAVLVLVGDGPLKADLLAHSGRLGLSEKNVRFVGTVAPSSVVHWLRVATVFALVSPSEGFSCALAEAMSTGLPSVVCDIPANRALVQDEINGLVVPVQNQEAVAKAITRIFEDAGLRERMADAARQHIVRNFSLGNVVDRYEALFEEILRHSY